MESKGFSQIKGWCRRDMKKQVQEFKSTTTKFDKKEKKVHLEGSCKYFQGWFLRILENEATRESSAKSTATTQKFPIEKVTQNAVNQEDTRKRAGVILTKLNNQADMDRIEAMSTAPSDIETCFLGDLTPKCIKKFSVTSLDYSNKDTIKNEKLQEKVELVRSNSGNMVTCLECTRPSISIIVGSAGLSESKRRLFSTGKQSPEFLEHYLHIGYTNSHGKTTVKKFFPSLSNTTVKVLDKNAHTSNLNEGSFYRWHNPDYGTLEVLKGEVKFMFWINNDIVLKGSCWDGKLWRSLPMPGSSNEISSLLKCLIKEKEGTLEVQDKNEYFDNVSDTKSNKPDMEHSLKEKSLTCEPVSEFSEYPVKNNRNKRVSLSEICQKELREATASLPMELLNCVETGPESWLNHYPWLLPCRYFVLSMGARASYELQIKSENISFQSDEGIGHCEANWGPKFPHAWFWAQGASSHSINLLFEKTSTCHKGEAVQFLITCVNFRFCKADAIIMSTVAYRSELLNWDFTTPRMDQISHAYCHKANNLKLRCTSSRPGGVAQMLGVNKTRYLRVLEVSIVANAKTCTEGHIPTENGFSVVPQGCLHSSCAEASFLAYVIDVKSKRRIYLERRKLDSSILEVGNHFIGKTTRSRNKFLVEIEKEFSN